VPEIIKLEEERVILAQFQKFQPMVLWSHCFRHVHGRNMWQRRTVGLMVAWKQRERQERVGVL
jgi:hypothetical protein